MSVFECVRTYILCAFGTTVCIHVYAMLYVCVVQVCVVQVCKCASGEMSEEETL